MRSFALFILLICLSGWLVFTTAPVAVCQEEPEITGELPLQLRDGLIQPQQRIWIPGTDGRPLMQITLEELRELERVYREATQLPAFLESTQLSVAIDSSFAKVSANFTAETRGTSTVQRFELGMKGCQLVEQPRFVESRSEGEITQQRVFPSQDGYQWLILSQQPDRHQVILEAKTLLEQNSDRVNFTLDLPLASTTIELILPPNAAEEKLRSEDVVVERTADESAVRLQVKSRGGIFSISWRESRPSGPLGTVEAKSDTVYEPFDLMDSSQIWSATTTLNIRWYGSDGGNKVQIALPPGGQWSSLPYSEFERFRLTTILRPSDSASSSSDANDRGANDRGASEVLVIENLDPAEFPAVENLNLQWRWLPAENNSDRSMAAYSVPSPEISGVDMHEGTIGLIFPSIYQFSYNEGPGVRFLDQGRLADLGLGRHQAQFTFQQHSAVVNVSFRQESQAPAVRSVYRVHVGEGRLDLTAWIRCWFDGGPMDLGFNPGEWTLDESSAVVLRDPTVPMTGLTEPLMVRSRGSKGFSLSLRDFESAGSKQPFEQTWRLSASRPWNMEELSEISFALPVLDRGIAAEETSAGVGSGILLVTSEKNILVKRSGNSEQEHWVENFSPDYQRYCAPISRRPLAFRFHDQIEPIEWSGRITLLPQQIAVTHKVEVGLAEQQVGIEQHFDFRIANRPLSRLRLLVREDALPVEVSVGDYLLPYEIVNTNSNDGSEESDILWKQLELTGIPELIGNARLTIRSAIDWRASLDRQFAATTSEMNEQQEPAAGSSPGSSPGQRSISVPLVQLLNIPTSSIGRTQCRAKPNVGFDISISDYPDRDPATTVSRPLLLELDPEQRTIQLNFRRRAAMEDRPVVTNGIWLQTVLSGSERRDRYVVRVRSSESPISIQLPEQSRVDTVALNGIQLGNDAAPYDYNSNRVAISLPNSNEHVVEVIYLLGEPLTWAHRLRMVPAQVLAASSQDRFYWQLVTPGVNHLGWCPAPLTSEWSWRWNTFGLQRSSQYDQEALEKWTGAAALTRLPLSANSYVMSGLDSFPTVEVWIFSRFALWFPIGVIAILFALAILNVPIIRTPNCFLLGSVLVGGAALLWPDMAMLIGQTALATLVLVALVLLTQAAVQSRVNRRSIFSTRLQTRREPSDAFAGSRGRIGTLSNAGAKIASLESTGAE